MRQQLAPFSPEYRALAIQILAGAVRAIRRSPKTPAIVVIILGAALCGVISGAIKSADGRAKRFASFVAGEVEKDAKKRNIKVLVVGAPGSFDISGRPPLQRRSTGHLVEAGGARTPYQAESVQICPSPEPGCWRVTSVTYGNPS
jgi:hypothetical protein